MSPSQSLLSPSSPTMRALRFTAPALPCAASRAPVRVARAAPAAPARGARPGRAPLAPVRCVKGMQAVDGMMMRRPGGRQPRTARRHAPPRSFSAAPKPTAAAADPDAAIEPDCKDRMEKALEAVKRSFASVRTGRAAPAMLDRVEVDYYGAVTPLKALAAVTTPDAGTLVIQPFDVSAIPMIEKAILASDVNITPGNDGKVIRLAVPPLTADRRKELTKTVAKLGEEGKVALRGVRAAANKATAALAKDKSISEDRKKALDKAIQTMTDAHVKQVDALVKGKQDELVKV